MADENEVENAGVPQNTTPDEPNLSLPELSQTDFLAFAEDTDNTGGDEAKKAEDLSAVFDIPVKVSAVLGRTRMEISELLKLGVGTVIELDRKVGEAIDVYVNNRLVARGEVVLVEDKLGITMTEIIKTEKENQ